MNMSVLHLPYCVLAMSLLLSGCGSSGSSDNLGEDISGCPDGQVECGGTCFAQSELTVDGPRGIALSTIEGSCPQLCGAYEIDMDAPISQLSPILENTQVEIGLDLHLRLNGEPFFPIGMWDMTPDVFEEASLAGFNMAGPFHACCDSGGLEEQLDYIGRAADVGLHSLLVPLAWSSARTDPFVDLASWYGEDLETLQSWIQVRANTPGFLGWMSWDEPQLNNTNRELMAALHSWLKTVDPDHPDALVDAPIRIDGWNDYAQLADLVDIQMTDPYPFGLELLAPLGVTNWMPGDSVSLLRDQVPDKPAWAVLQAHDQLAWLCESEPFQSIIPACTENVDEEGRYIATSGPPAKMMRNHAFQAITQGANAIYWYSYDPSTRWNLPDYPEQFEALKEIAGVISRITPALLSEERTADVGVISASEGERTVGVRAHRIQGGDSTLLIVTNPLELPAFIELDLSDLSEWDENQCIADIEEKTGQVPFQGGTIKIELAPLEVRLLQIGSYSPAS